MRETVINEVRSRRSEILSLALELLKIPCETEQEDTSAITDFIKKTLSGREGVTWKSCVKKGRIENLIVSVKGSGEGKTLAFNGHLDTFPVGDRSLWTRKPEGELEDDKWLYGRGAADMKGAVAAYLFTLICLWERREEWRGELRLILVGDEQRGGTYGTKYLLEEIPETTADSVINGDMGSPCIIRIGEKGLVWTEIRAEGRGGHGAFVHQGINAAERLIRGIKEIGEALRKLQESQGSSELDSLIAASAPVLEHYGLRGEAEILRSITSNLGYIKGGSAVNLIPDQAAAGLDIRIPCGFTTKDIMDILDRVCGENRGLSYRIVDAVEPNWTEPAESVVNVVRQNCDVVFRSPVTVTCRVGASDSAYYRQRGVPAVNCGLTAHNAGREDEYVSVDELVDLTAVFVMSALDYLTPKI